MIVRECEIGGVHTIDLALHSDERGFFARAFCADTMRALGLEGGIAQINVSYSERRGTLRGMHYQRAPHEETKIVRCVRGAVFDVAIDLRPSSPTHRRWIGVELDDRNRRALYVPAGVAHGFLTLSEDAELLYLMGSSHVPDAASGVRFDDPAFGIQWPFAPTVISDRDRAYPDYAA